MARPASIDGDAALEKVQSLTKSVEEKDFDFEAGKRFLESFFDIEFLETLRTKDPLLSSLSEVSSHFEKKLQLSPCGDKVKEVANYYLNMGPDAIPLLDVICNCVQRETTDTRLKADVSTEYVQILALTANRRTIDMLSLPRSSEVEAALDKRRFDSLNNVTFSIAKEPLYNPSQAVAVGGSYNVAGGGRGSGGVRGSGK